MKDVFDIVSRMEFWSSQQGPHYGGSVHVSDLRCIGEVACPAKCSSLLARLYDAPEGALVSCWIPAHGAAPADPGGRVVGWQLSTLIDLGKAEAAAPLTCWNGHHGFEISTGLCREIEAAYRVSGRKVRRPANWARSAHA